MSDIERGLPMSPAQLITDLEEDDRLVRSSAYDELVIVTGVRLPFDVSGSWRVQKAQIGLHGSHGGQKISRVILLDVGCCTGNRIANLKS